MAPDPLFDTLFRQTTLTPAIASAAPVRAAGTRSRAGNAMNRTRAALLDGARRAVEVSGTKITMAQVATAAGVAKATLYNHFRTREAVLSALLVDEVNTLAAECAGRPLPQALSTAANALARHPLLRTLARIEPATLATIGCIDTTAEGWRIAHEALAVALAADSRGGTDTVLRWLASYVVSPATPTSVAADLAIVLAGLPDVPDRVDGERREAQPA
ncbi:MAG: transcriptional regulator, TetR family [Pseudonocardiales bacterium]|nr:transcriptional regulator, TetR family [Pseudonocardiales bacterium]